MYTLHDIHTWVEDHQAICQQTFQKCNAIPTFIKISGSKIELAWSIGHWLVERLREAGASTQEVSDITFAHGQRSCCCDPYEWALAYINHFIQTREVLEKPGADLAKQIFIETFLTEEEA